MSEKLSKFIEKLDAMIEEKKKKLKYESDETRKIALQNKLKFFEHKKETLSKHLVEN